jgi:hypothetical protein
MKFGVNINQYGFQRISGDYSVVPLNTTYDEISSVRASIASFFVNSLPIMPSYGVLPSSVFTGVTTEMIDQ